MIKLPPSLIHLITLLIGLAIGAGGMWQVYSKEKLTVTAEVRDADNKQGKAIDTATKGQLENKALKKTILKYKKRAAIKCPGMTDEEIDSACVSRYAPSDIVQSIRDQINRARGRTD